MSEIIAPSAPQGSSTHRVAPDFLDVAGASVAYRRKGRGELVLYLHGEGMTRTWLPFLDALAAQYDVIAPEHPGFGDSPLPADLDTFEDFVLHYDALLDVLGLPEVHLVGHGLGGWIAADLAVFYPRRFKSLTLVTPTGLRLDDVPSIDTFRMSPEDLAAARFNGRDERFAGLLAHGEDNGADLVQAFQERSTSALLAWNPRYDRKLTGRLARVTAPTLVLGAEEDRVVPTEMAARFSELIPGARLVTLQGDEGEPSGHALHVEHPEKAARLVSDHVQACA